MANIGNLTVRLNANTRNLDRALRRADRRISTFARSARRNAAIATAALAGIGAGAAHLVKLASEAEELNNVINQSFGDMSKQINNWAKDTGDAMNRSRHQMRRFAAFNQAILKPLLGTNEATAQMSRNLTKLAVDMGSFFDVADKQAFEAIQSGLMGMVRPLRQFGIDMTQATLEAYALRKGIDSNIQEMSQAEKVQLRYNYLMENTAHIQGDAVRTAGSFANRMKGLRAQLDNLQRNLGDYLLPIATRFVEKLTAMVENFNALDDTMKSNILKWATLASGVLAAVAVFGLLATALQIAFKGFVLLASIVSMISSPVILAIMAIAGAALLMYTAWENNWSGIRDIVSNVWENTLKPTFNDIWDWLKKAWDWTINLAGGAWDWLDEKAPWLTTTIEKLKEWLDTTWSWGIETTKNAWQWITDTTWREKLHDMKGWLTDGWKWAIEIVEKGASWLWNLFEDKFPKTAQILETAWNWTANLVGDIANWIHDVVWPWIKGSAPVAWNWTVEKTNELFNWIKNTAAPWINENVETMWIWGVKGVEGARNVIEGNVDIIPRFTVREGTITAIEALADFFGWVHGTGAAYKLGEIVGILTFELLKFTWNVIKFIDDLLSYNYDNNQIQMALDELVINVAKVTWQFMRGFSDSLWEALTGRTSAELGQETIDFLTPRNPGLQGIDIPFRAGGGMISGPGTETSDSIPAMLSDGEYIMNAQSTRKFLPLLEAMNNNKFAAGGLVGNVSFAGMNFDDMSGWLKDIGSSLDRMGQTLIRVFRYLIDVIITAIDVIGRAFGVENLGQQIRDSLAYAMDWFNNLFKPQAEEAGMTLREEIQDIRASLRNQQKSLKNTLSIWDMIVEKYNEFTEVVSEQSGNVNELANIVGRFNKEAADSINSFQELINAIADLPQTIEKVNKGFAGIRKQVSAAFGGGPGGRFAGMLAGGAAGWQSFSQGTAGTNWLGGISGILAGMGIGNPVTGALAAGSEIVNAIFPGKPKNEDDRGLQERIRSMNQTLSEWGASFRSRNLWFEKDAGFLGWRNLFGNVKWETHGKKAAERGAEIAEQIINSMKQTFASLGNQLGNVIINNLDFSQFSQFVGRRLQQMLMEGILQAEAVKGPLQRLSAFMAEAVRDGLTSGEIENIKKMASAVYDSVQPFADVAEKIAEEFGIAEEVADNFEDAEESAKGIGQALRNVPRGFKISTRRFQTADPIPSAQTGAYVKTAGLVKVHAGEDITPAGQGGDTYNINVEGPVYGMTDLEDKITEIMSRVNRRNSMDAYGTVG